ncbi:DNA phosphorothioation-associated putative methyltransferase [Paraburkholderia fungorum]
MDQRLGKRVVDDLYLHRETLVLLAGNEREAVDAALLKAPQEARERANVVKVNLRNWRVSLLVYPDFFDDPFPSLAESWVFDQASEAKIRYRSYSESLNPPILHRKELLLTADHALRTAFSITTQQAEELGLFDNTAVIGFRLNWERQIFEKGYRLENDRFLPLGNTETDGAVSPESQHVGAISRHLTALSRSSLSAPVQLLARHNLLSRDWTFFDYGCGRGDDMAGLREIGYSVGGWDPHYAPGNAVTSADVVNLGFVLNVIEDPAERVEALQRAFRLTQKVLAVGVMLESNRTAGLAYGDGFLTSRNTFQKYYSQDELKDYLEQVLQKEAFPVGPGVALIFADEALEQLFLTNRYRARGVGRRLAMLGRIKAAHVGRRYHAKPAKILSDDVRQLLSQLWETTLELGRLPESDEIDFLSQVEEKLGSFHKALRVMSTQFDPKELRHAANLRADDLRLFFATQHFAKRANYRSLERRLQRDIRALFGDYRAAQSAGTQLLTDAADPEKVKQACNEAAQAGGGWLDADHALLFHVSMVERLPAVLRAYIACGLILFGDAAEIQLLKIHASSGKLSLMQYEDFDTVRLPRMSKRVKINLRKLDLQVFEYGGPYEKPLLYYKSRYLSEEHPGYAEQQNFDEKLANLALFDPSDHGPSENEFRAQLEERRWTIVGNDLARVQTVPSLEQSCGAHFKYRDFVDCGDTQRRLRVLNVPQSPETYNALRDLTANVLDPLIDYFGSVRLTYGVCSHQLGKHIKLGVASKLDQHAAFERDHKGRLICERGGAACDFIVDDENMRDVAQWIIKNLPFDRLYFYSEQRPIHVSYSTEPLGLAYEMKESSTGQRIPRLFIAS